MGKLKRHVILVGLPGAGKTTAGRLAAQQLGASFVDFDALIEARAGKPVARIFEEDGEPVFRAHESVVAAEQLAAAPAVLSPGGGFMMDEAQRRWALSVGYGIYLRTSPVEAARRLHGAGDRPLLKGGDPVGRLRELLERRESAYLQAPGRVTTDARAVEQVADEIVKLARAEAGW